MSKVKFLVTKMTRKWIVKIFPYLYSRTILNNFNKLFLKDWKFKRRFILNYRYVCWVNELQRDETRMLYTHDIRTIGMFLKMNWMRVFSRRVAFGITTICFIDASDNRPSVLLVYSWNGGASNRWCL